MPSRVKPAREKCELGSRMSKQAKLSPRYLGENRNQLTSRKRAFESTTRTPAAGPNPAHPTNSLAAQNSLIEGGSHPMSLNATNHPHHQHLYNFDRITPESYRYQSPTEMSNGRQYIGILSTTNAPDCAQGQSLRQTPHYSSNQLNSLDYAGNTLFEPAFGSDLRCSPDSFTFEVSDYDSLLLEPPKLDEVNLPVDPTYGHIGTTMPPDMSPYECVAHETDTLSRTSKRMRDNSDSDLLQACWTSPLCPQMDKARQDSPPDPTTCDGACLPHVFSSSPGNEAPAGSAFAHTPVEYGISEQQEAVRNHFEGGQHSSPPVGAVIDSNSTEAVRPSGLSAPDTATTRRQPSRSAKLKSEPVKTDVITDSIPQATPKAANGRTRGRMPHNQVERKYRESLNAQLEALRRVVPSLHSPNNVQSNGRLEEADMEDLAATSMAGKPSKALILANATSYIKHLERERQREQAEIVRLKERIAIMSKLVSGGVQSNGGHCDECQVLGWVRGLNLSEACAGERPKEA